MSTNSNVVVRVFEPLTEYVLPGFRHRDAIYAPDAEVVFAATRQIHDALEYVTTEVATLLPEEVRLCATLALSVPEGRGIAAFVPSVSDTIALDSATDLSDPGSVARCRKSAIELLKQNRRPKREYEFRDAERSDSETEKRIFEAIDVEDGVLIRGLYTLLKSQALVGCDLTLFMEEAFMNAQISREAALQLIREHLQATGRPNASFADAHDYIRRSFDLGEPLAKFFEDLHEKWVETKHPFSSVGEEWAPSIWADDVTTRTDA
jgi:hypothetical protein